MWRDRERNWGYLMCENRKFAAQSNPMPQLRNTRSNALILLFLLLLIFLNSLFYFKVVKFDFFFAHFRIYFFLFLFFKLKQNKKECFFSFNLLEFYSFLLSNLWVSIWACVRVSFHFLLYIILSLSVSLSLYIYL